MYPAQPIPPSHLDEEGQRLWQAYIESGIRYRDAKREYSAAKRAYRARVSPRSTPDPEKHARYIAAHEAVETWRDAHTLASQAYHAYSRRRIARIAVAPPGQRTRRSAGA